MDADHSAITILRCPKHVQDKTSLLEHWNNNKNQPPKKGVPLNRIPNLEEQIRTNMEEKKVFSAADFKFDIHKANDMDLKW